MCRRPLEFSLAGQHAMQLLCTQGHPANDLWKAPPRRRYEWPVAASMSIIVVLCIGLSLNDVCTS